MDELIPPPPKMKSTYIINKIINLFVALFFKIKLFIYALYRILIILKCNIENKIEPKVNILDPQNIPKKDEINLNDQVKAIFSKRL